MTKPRNPYRNGIDYGMHCAWDEGYVAGLGDGEKRLARALRRWAYINATCNDFTVHYGDIKDWLSARLKKERKK